MIQAENAKARCEFEHLGQAGLKVIGESLCILIDPCPGNSVQLLDSPNLARQMSIAYIPATLTNVDWVLIAHEHMEHWDPHTILKIARASSKARFIGPEPVRRQLLEWGISASRIQALNSSVARLGNGLTSICVPAENPNILFAGDGQARAAGNGSWLCAKVRRRSNLGCGRYKRLRRIIKRINDAGPIDTDLLPFNEDKFFRRRRSILGNMSIRESFSLDQELDIKKVIPVHWDLFEVNGVSPNEIKAVSDASPGRSNCS